MDEIEVDYGNFRVRSFSVLTVRELYEILRVRCDVFVRKKRFFILMLMVLTMIVFMFSV